MKGISLFKHKLFNEAKEIFNKILEIEPENVKALLSLGQIFHIEKNYDEAIKYYDKALEKEPEYANAIHSKGISLDFLKKKRSK